MYTLYGINLYTNNLSRGFCKHPAPSYAYTCTNQNFHTDCYIELPSAPLSILDS